MGCALILSHDAGDYMSGAAALGHEVLGSKANTLLDNGKGREFF
jgi:hypothetical protein